MKDKVLGIILGFFGLTALSQYLDNKNEIKKNLLQKKRKKHSN